MNVEEILRKCNGFCKNNLLEFFNIEFIDAGEDFLKAKMLVCEKNAQIEGILHGGASAALAESVGSMASIVLKAKEGEIVRGIDIILNHTSGARIGEEVFCTAKAIHLGRTLQHWDIKITNKDQKLIAYGKHTTIILSK